MKEPVILKTEDHDIFKDITSNREVDRRHVKHLKDAIKEINLLHINPILVNINLEVVDGQHRLEAARELELPVYYLVDDNISKEHIAGLNSNQKNWTILDYVNYYAVERIPEYLVLSDFICQHPSVSISTLLQLLNPSGERNSKNFKAGKLNVSNKEKAKQILKDVDAVRNLGIEHAYDRNFVLALKDAHSVEGYRSEQFLTKLENNRLELFKCAKKTQYLQLIEQIYNKHQHTKLRFY